MGRTIVVTSGKGGTGKTTASAAISSYLTSGGSRVLCIDADAGLKNLDLCLGLSDRAVFDYGDVLAGRCRLDEAVLPHPDIPGLFFLTAPVAPAEGGEDAQGFEAMVRFAAEHFDYCIIDSPAGLGSGFRAAVSAADSAIILAVQDPSSRRDSARVVMELASLGVKDIRLIVNRVRRSVFSRSKLTIDDVIDSVGAQLLGVVPEDENVPVAAAREIPLFLSGEPGRAALAFMRIARRIKGEKVPLEIR
jgi:septum site-determining protein MinD